MGGGRRGGRSEKRGGRRASGKKVEKGREGKKGKFCACAARTALSREEGDKGREGR